MSVLGMITSKTTVLMILLTGFLQYSIADFSQNNLTYLAQNLELHYDVIDNLEDDATFTSRISLTNGGNRIIERGPWAIYFNSIRLIEPSHLMENPRGYVLKPSGLKVVHIVGSLFKLEPVQGFQALFPGQSLDIKLRSQHFSVARTDVMPNFYVGADGLQAVNIVNTTNESLTFVGKFDTKEKWKRYKKDMYDPFTPERRLERNTAKYKTVGVSVIPTSVEMIVDNDQNVEINDWVIVTSERFKNEADYLAEKLKMNVNTDSANIPKSKIIQFIEKNVTVNVNGQNDSNKEAYVVNVSSSGNIITIAAPEPRGAFYGVQSLLSIMDYDRKRVPKVQIRDAPRFGYRGMMLDIARNFHGKNTIIKMLDAMAMYKMNKLHLHLTDDEGWRLEIPGLEELTKFGGKRCHNTKVCLAPQLGSGATTSSSGTGHLTVHEYQDILKHAKKLHIEVIPEFDMPGHSHAAIKAIEYRFMKYNNSADQSIRENASQFLLSESGDTSKYFSVQMFRDNAVNPCLDTTYDFVEHIVVTLIGIHKDISPLNIFHMGGDEVAKGAWLNSSACQELISRNPQISSVKNLKEYFFTKLSNITSKYHIDLAAWEDGLIQDGKPFDTKKIFNSNVFSYAWDNVWEWGTFNRSYLLANAGYKNVMCQATHLYFDMPYEPDPKERGFYWATRYTDTKKTFGFMPDNLYANAKEELSGKPTSEAKLCTDQNACPPLTKPSNVIGLQAHLWTETVRTEDQVFYMIFPRMLAAAERAWHKAFFESETNEENRDQMRNSEWETFANIVGRKELNRLDSMGINYRVPLPGAKLVEGKLVTRSAFPGLKIEYRTDGKFWQEYKPEIELTGKVKLRTTSANGKRSSRCSD